MKRLLTTIPLLICYISNALASGGSVAEQAASSGGGGSRIVGLIIFVCTAILFVVMIVALVRLNNRCAECGCRRALERSDERVETENGVWGKVYKVAYKCRYCGHVEWRNEAENEGQSEGFGGGPKAGRNHKVRF
jgi:hypothetical protein